MRQESSSVTTRRNSYVAPRIGLLAHGFRRLDLHRVPLPSPTHALSGYDEGPLPTYSGGTAPVFHRTSLLCPFRHPRDHSAINSPLYRSQLGHVKLEIEESMQTRGLRLLPVHLLNTSSRTTTCTLLDQWLMGVATFRILSPPICVTASSAPSNSRCTSST
jgi:hypothetical protein